MSSAVSMMINMGISSKPVSHCVPTNASKLQRISRTTNTAPRSFKCINANSNSCTDQNSTTTRRRSGNYNPPLWDFNYLQSLSSEYKSDRYLEKVTELVAQVEMMLEKETKDVRRLELIDNLQNLGISYHFEEKIKQILNCINQRKCLEGQRDLYSTALMFRLLRQHGFSVSQGIFDCFKNEKGEFKASLEEDPKGVLQLYEASFLLTEGEETLETARLFSTNVLQKKIDHGLIDDHNLSLMVCRSLEVPLHWTLQSLNKRWFIDAYAYNEHIMNPVVLYLAKLDFNILQETYRQEIKQVSRWWEQSGLAKKLPFARDRVVECFLWAVGELSEPEYVYARIINTKINIMVTIVDDMFDVYGSLDELELFNHIIQRWNIEEMEQLPDYMQICFLALNNLINEIAYDVLKEQGSLIIPYLRKSWADLCRTYIKEARWYNQGYNPSVKEYIDNAWISVGPPLMLTHEFFLLTNPIRKEDVESLYEYHNIIRFSSTIVRLANDLGTSQDEMERGDVPKSVQCYMNETGANKEEAEEYVRSLIRETWRNLNEERKKDSPFSQDFVKSATNLGRFAQFMYQYGDGHGVQDLQFKHRISALLFEPID